MVIPANGTLAKDIALHFLELVGQPIHQKNMQRTIPLIKTLLASGYQREDIELVITYLLNKGTRMYSFGYVSACMEDVLPRAKEDLAVQQTKAKQAELAKQSQNEVQPIGESSERNRDKIGHFGIQSGFRTKHHFDLFERPGETD